MKAILIDDEELALMQLERLLRDDGRYQVSGKYTTARAGLEHLAREQADVVFLDIGMPGIGGLEAGEKIRELNRNVHIVYITAYSDYALEAFELQALDYLLKPVNPARFVKTLDRILMYSPVSRHLEDKQAGTFHIQCFQRLELTGIAKLRWRTNKTQELFAFLLHYKNKWVSKDQILEELWGAYEQDRSITHLHTSIYQIRKMLKDEDIQATVEYAQDSYRLAATDMMTDVEEFESACLNDGVATEQDRTRAIDAMALYKGDYLAEHDYDWSKPRRRELLRKYIGCSLALVRYEMDTEREEQAVKRLEILQESDPYSEEICRHILLGYAKLNNGPAVRQHYEAFASILRSDLGIKPSPQTEALYDKCLESFSL
ncbi:response regulator [Paenibacillus sp. GCM10012307]|uniref:Response regulator n=1 Tax=Paenibacillus roseus TaxID=2798579 RepID=A0A934J3C0_9BACL|nr:response regulator [Paenibacillus roseus]MBJ6363992.1 response regulator [Paenibacillus roseus]